MELFVSGRLCLFGEHSDWAGEYRQVNLDLEPGYAIVVGTNQGVYARVATNSYLSFKTLHSSEKLNLAMSEDLLLAVAQSNHFYSYVAGTAYQTLIRYRVGGIAIDNYRMDLPLQKGLSSSAAVCVLIAKAFNRLVRSRFEYYRRNRISLLGRKNNFQSVWQTRPGLCLWQTTYFDGV